MSHDEFSSKSPTPDLSAGTKMTDHRGVEMVYVPAGKFLMGANEYNIEEKPIHEVCITDPFWLDLTPVTHESYARFVDDDGYKNSAWWVKTGWEWLQTEKIGAPRDFNGFTHPQQPRVGISWFEAAAYAAWRGGRLPSEAEWEWAARGPENRTYPWGNMFDASRIICNLRFDEKSAVVGSGIRVDGASWVGALDMSGNVCEWCSSLYRAYPYRADDGRETLEGNGARVLRGGSWNYDQDYARGASRFDDSPFVRDSLFGFRVVRSASG